MRVTNIRLRRMLAVIVNGLPAAGKTTLSRRLAPLLGLPLFGKDAVKETLADILGVTPPAGSTLRQWNLALGAATNESLWTLLGESQRGAVIESPYLAHVRHLVVAGLARAGVAHDDVHEVWCDVPLELARLRFDERAPVRHPIHFDDQDKSTEWAHWATVAEPLCIGTLHHVDTTTRPPDEVIAALARTILSGGHPQVDPGLILTTRRRCDN
jgi:predicted kinase